MLIGGVGRLRGSRFAESSYGVVQPKMALLGVMGASHNAGSLFADVERIMEPVSSAVRGVEVFFRAMAGIEGL